MNGTIGANETLWVHSDFRKLWAAQAVSAVGSRVTRTALPIIAITTLNASAVSVSILSAMAMAPGVVVAVFAAGQIDRSRKRPLLISMDLARAALLLTIPLAGLLDILTMAHLILVAALAGAATAIFNIADTAYLPRLVPAALLVDGNTRLQTSEAIAEIAGPSLAGVLIQAVTAPVAIVTDALSFVWSAAWLARIQAGEATAPPSEHHNVLRDAVVGWRSCSRHPIVFPLLLSQGIFGLFGGFFSAMYMVFTLRTLGLDAATIGLVIGVGGIGALWGALAATPLSKLFGIGRAAILCLAMWMLASAFIPASEGRGIFTIPFLVMQQLVGDGFLSAFMILAVSVRQTALDPDIQARAGATFQVVEGLSLPAGALIAGPLASVVGAGGVLWIAIAGASIPLAILAFSPLWRLKTLADSRIPA